MKHEPISAAAFERALRADVERLLAEGHAVRYVAVYPIGARHVHDMRVRVHVTGQPEPLTYRVRLHPSVQWGKTFVQLRAAKIIEQCTELAAA